MKTKAIRFLFKITIVILAFSALSCSGKKSADEKAFEKAQNEYNNGGLSAFTKFVTKNAYYAVTDSAQNGATPLMLVLQGGDVETAKLFMEKGASASEKDSGGNDCIDYALKASDSGNIAYALSIMPASYWDSENQDGALPFVKIIVNCADYAIVKKAIDFTSDIHHADSNGKTSLVYAAQFNTDVRATKYLLDKACELNAQNKNEWTALMYAARYNPNPAVMEDLLLRGANAEPNSVGLTLTMLASCNPNTGVLLTLLKYKNEVNAQTDKGKTALMYACENQRDSSVIKILIENGAELNTKDDSGKTALMYALENYEKPESVYVLLAAGAKTDDSDSDKKTAREYLSANAKLSKTDVVNAFGVTKTVSVPEDEPDEKSETEDTVEQNSEEIEETEETGEIEEIKENENI